ncbi:hypothetical protein ACNQFZ_18385 [Schinkia sp. CFF1]
MSKLLLDDEPLVVLPSLAKVIGLNESIVLQQLHYWIQKSNHVHDGFTWVYNSVKKWQDQFPFWSVSTINRVIKKLENDNLILSDNFNKSNFDKTKWYRINYEKLGELSSENQKNRFSQNEQIDDVKLNKPIISKWPMENVNLTKPIPEITSDIDDDDNDEERTHKSEIDFSDGVPTTVPEQQVKEVSLNQDPDKKAAAIEQRYIQQRACGLFLSAKDLQAIYEIAKSNIELSDIIAWLDESFSLFKPKFNGDKINSFIYCKTHILHRHYEKQMRAEAKQQKGVGTAAARNKNNDAYKKRQNLLKGTQDKEHEIIELTEEERTEKKNKLFSMLE